MADAQPAIEVVLANEGGYVFDSSDPGGETNFGISKRSYPDLDIKNLTRDSATQIYLRDFWKYDRLTSQAVATKVLDTCVNLGQTRGIALCQRAVGTKADGIYGALTEGAFNGSQEAELLSEIRLRLVSYYNNLVSAKPQLQKFLKGWLRRAGQ
jgi:lysozyme family protein